MAMDLKGITWDGNIYQKFENMCLEVEEMMFEDTVKYIENQMQTVGASVKKLYSDIMQDLLPSSSCELDEKVASELPIDQYTDAGFCKKTIQVFKERPVKADTKQTTKDSRINHDVDSDVTDAAAYNGSFETDGLFISASGNSVKGNNFISHAIQYVGSTDVKPNLAIDESLQNRKMPATKTFSEITFSKTDTCGTSQSCELSNQNKNHAVTVSKPASSKVTRLASAADCRNEIENGSTDQIPNAMVLIKSAEEKEMNKSCSYPNVLVADSYEFLETWSLDAMKIDTDIEQGHQTMQHDDKLKLEKTCVMVTGEELKLAGGNLKTNKKKRRQAFSLSRKSARKQEYEELAIWQGNNENGRGYCMENLDLALLEDQQKLQLPNIFEPEWELL